MQTTSQKKIGNFSGDWYTGAKRLSEGAKRPSLLGGSGGMPPRKNFKNWMQKGAFWGILSHIYELLTAQILFKKGLELTLKNK